MESSGNSASDLPPFSPGPLAAEELVPSKPPEYRLIVGLNFGATHTSVAYLPVRGDRYANMKEGAQDIHIVQGWPCNESSSVPSRISYSPTTRGCRQWGYDIDDGAYIHESLRLQLEDASTHQELVSLHDLVKEAATDGLSASVTPSLHKSPELMAVDFLRKVAEQLRDEIGGNVGKHILEELPLDLVVSYPSLWPEAVKRRYFQVIESAFDLSLLPTLRHVYFLAEAEAVSQWCVMSESEPLSLCGVRKGMSVIVCDTEGSSVKATATSYTFEQVEPEFKLRKIGYLARANAGWAAVEAELQSLLVIKRHIGYSTLLTWTDPDTRGRSLWDMILQKFQPIMHGFDDMNRLSYPIQLPRGFQTAKIDLRRGILNGCLSLSPEDLKELFNPSIQSLVQMLSDQIELADQAGIPAKVFIFNGAFLNQKYVLKMLKGFARTRGIQVVGVEHGGNSARGSVLHALGLSTTPILPVIKIAHHYGIAHHDSHLLPDSSSHARKTPELVEWVLAKGEAVFPDAGEPRSEKLRILRRYKPQDCAPGRMSRVVVVIYSSDTPSSGFQALESHSTRSLDLDFELSLIPENQRRAVTIKAWLFGKTKSLYFDVELCVTFSVSQFTITISVSCGGTLLAEKQIMDNDE